ncbi:MULTISPECIES: PIG-L deacetylase family protein [unclassified Halomonas]|uniref:PIG-L deacetylase family protein n=1 Tax=unclassified Halomonas TaxID=2609666 RepID=UPI0007D9309F|nr:MULTISPECIES: PIG-L deacetylase family protein [unclassified Halomonas]MBT2787210.1 PIG-L family deacetylase [Halomonas sp. ISL-106]MBT2796426.1 PIG-L family deacetylase [Halomonas sp. ISL-104]OAL57808.1 hypothetical protein A6R74_11675 [Halomonas sp. ALS9]
MREAWYVPYHASDLVGKRVIVLAPHPDDEVFGCGGALAHLVAQGAEIQVIIATQGPQAALRLCESKKAAQLLGYPAPINWEFTDRGLEEAREALTQQLLETLLEFQPDLLLAPSCWEMHPDHRAACDAALQAGARFVEQSDVPLNIALYEIGVPLSANQLVDISSVSALKAEAMTCFASQLAEQRYAEQITGLNQYRSYTLGLGVTAAEAFHIVFADAVSATVTLPSVQDQALLRCEKALQQSQLEYTHHIDSLQSDKAVLQKALKDSQHARQEAEQTLQAIYATRSWRWLSRLKYLLGRG